MAKEFEMELPEEVKSVFSEIIVTPDMLIQGDHLIDIPLPDNTLVVLVKRFNHFLYRTDVLSYSQTINF